MNWFSYTCSTTFHQRSICMHCSVAVTSDGDVSSDVAVKSRAMKTTQRGNGVVGGRPPSVTVTTGTTSKESTASSRNQVGSTTTGQTKHRFKRKPRILFSQAQVCVCHSSSSSFKIILTSNITSLLTYLRIVPSLFDSQDYYRELNIIVWSGSGKHSSACLNQ